MLLCSWIINIIIWTLSQQPLFYTYYTCKNWSPQSNVTGFEKSKFPHTISYKHLEILLIIIWSVCYLGRANRCLNPIHHSSIRSYVQCSYCLYLAVEWIAHHFTYVVPSQTTPIPQVLLGVECRWGAMKWQANPACKLKTAK